MKRRGDVVVTISGYGDRIPTTLPNRVTVGDVLCGITMLVSG